MASLFSVGMEFPDLGLVKWSLILDRGLGFAPLDGIAHSLEQYLEVIGAKHFVSANAASSGGDGSAFVSAEMPRPAIEERRGSPKPDLLMMMPVVMSEAKQKSHTLKLASVKAKEKTKVVTVPPKKKTCSANAPSLPVPRQAKENPHRRSYSACATKCGT